MDVIKMARDLGKAIQADERYKAYYEAKNANDADEKLQNMIGEFNLQRQQIGQEVSKPEEEKNEEKIKTLNESIQALYTDIMANANMAAFAVAKDELDKLLNDVNAIIMMCCEGQDPDTCEPSSCGGDCGGCSGCH